MIHDLKHVAPQYPAHHHVPQHNQAVGAANVLAILIAVAVLGLGCYVLGQQDGRSIAAGATEPSASIGECEASSDTRDVIEHTWTHRGHVVARECVLIERPSYVSPRYSVQTPALTGRAP